MLGIPGELAFYRKELSKHSFVKRLCKRDYTGPCVVYKWVIYLYIGAWLLASSSSHRLLMHGLGGG